MNDRRTDRETKLLTGAFHDDWAGGTTADFARVAAAHARWRRVVRRVFVVGSAATMFAIAGFVASHHRPSSPPVMPSPAAASAYEIISDAQLLAALNDRPMLVVKKGDGSNEITLLTPKPESAESLAPAGSE